jgi:rhodanese-related sulfurtransferase
MTEAEFITEVTEGLLPPPAYFGMNVAMNKSGIESFTTVLKKGLNPIEATQFETITEETGALILDTRSNGDFAKGFVPQSINIGIAGDFAPWVGALIADVKQPIVLVTDIGKEEETVTRLSRVGFDHIVGYLAGGFEAWKKAGFEIDTINRIAPEQFANEIKVGESTVVDVRKTTEYAAEHVEEAYNKPLASINDWIKDINPENHFYMHCSFHLTSTWLPKFYRSGWRI